MKRKYDKHAARRRRCRELGLCRHCGLPCAPFAECDVRREAKRRSAPAPMKRGAYIKSAEDPRRMPRGLRRNWTKVEDDTLREFLLQGVSLEEMAAYFNRKETAVMCRARKLGSTLFLKRKNRGDGRVFVL